MPKIDAVPKVFTPTTAELMEAIILLRRVVEQLAGTVCKMEDRLSCRGFTVAPDDKLDSEIPF